jgi:hypothetical protein
MIGTSVNKEHTKEESRTYRSQFEVSFILPTIAFIVCSSSLSFFISKLTINIDKEKYYGQEIKSKEFN